MTRGEIAHAAVAVLVGPPRAGFSAIRATILEQQLEYWAKTRTELDGVSHPQDAQCFTHEKRSHQTDLRTAMLVNESEMLFIVDLEVSHSFRNRMRGVEHNHVLQLIRWVMATYPCALPLNERTLYCKNNTW